MIESGKLEERNRTSRRSGAQPAVSQVESSVASLQQKQQQQQQQQQQQRQQSHKHQQRMAPLASLDCSITEPLSEPAEQVQVHLLNQQQQQQQQRQRRPSPVETPTLSGYFDCDQLSDMVDGSLFEITYAGCLSRTVFAVNGPPATTTHRQPASLAIISRDTSSAGEDNESSDSAERPESGAKTPTNAEPPPAQQESLEQTAPMKPKSQLELLANYQPYDYSSTSRVPAQTRQASGAAASQVSHLALQQQYSSGVSTASGNSHKQRGTRQSGRLSVGVGSSRSQPLSAGAGVKSQRSQQHQHQRKSRSNPDMRDGPAEPAGAGGLCATCREQEAVKKKEKKRFTFSLFNLFTGGASSSSSESNHPLKRDHCQHRRRCAPGTGTGTSGAGGAESRRSKHAPTNHAGSQLKTRDSIRLTNQRKMRNNLMRASNSCAELQRPAEPPELLLDFPAGSGELLLAVADLQQQQVPIRASQSSNNIQRSRRDSNNSNSNHLHHYYHHHHHGNNLKAAAAANATIPINKASQRLTKSVKFTTPDRVLIVPANGRAGEISGSDRAGPNHQLPPADRLPSAPIIKRPVVKASAYAQTEPNKSLYEMLAKYEGNADLIVEINEKLKLTETIASPMSSLDRPTTTTTTDDDDDNGAPNKLTSHLAHSNENNIEPRHHHQQQTEAPLFLLSPTETRLPIGSTTTVVVEPSLLLSTAEEAHHLKANEHDDINNNHYHHHDNDSNINGTNPQEPTVKSAAITYCQPTDRNSSDGSTIQIEEAAEAEEAGFSQNWLHKQRAFV